jgi:hypothetical protein
MDFNRWIRQPTTIHAIGVVAAGFGAALAQVTTGNHTVDAAVAILAYVLTHLGIDDHSVMETSTTALAADLIHGAPTAKIIGDAVTLGGAVQTVASAPANPPAAA